MSLDNDRHVEKHGTIWQKGILRGKGGVDIMQKSNLCMQNIMVPVAGSMLY